MATNSKSSLAHEIHVLELESKIEGLQHKGKQIKIEIMRLQARIPDLEEAIGGIDANIAEAQTDLSDYKAAHLEGGE